MKQIIFYKTADDKCPYLEWYNSLDNSIKPHILKRLIRVKEGNSGDYKKINAELSELRFKIGKGYRIYYSEYKNYIVILICAGDKSTQQKNIKNANQYIKDFKERYKNG